ncbi:MAG: glycine dehydrogenase, partial [Rhodovibrionaceae bacterium]|nr:glycine dehydrogenase [Rhodovibrionaceae bacterium]
MSTDAPTLKDLENRGDFRRRHVGPGPQDTEEMLSAIGLDSLDGLIDKAVPRTIESDTPFDLPPPMTEAEALDRLAQIASRNRIFRSFIGMGYHGTFTPSVIRRNVIENPGWYTAYTPYQPEISQGRLEALVNFQQMIMDLTGMPVANASLLDEATAAAEAMTLLHRADKGKRNRFFVDSGCHPQTVAVVEARAQPLDIEVAVGDPHGDLDAEACFGALLQYPTTGGLLRDDRALIAKTQEAGCRVAVAADLLALALLVPPGEMGADIVLGSAQRFGVPLGFGGPHAAYFACKDDFRRSIPGRIVGVSVDANGQPAMRLALQTREQHIRREKATSNICTAQVLLAVIAGFYAVYHGPDG